MLNVFGHFTDTFAFYPTYKPLSLEGDEVDNIRGSRSGSFTTKAP